MRMRMRMKRVAGCPGWACRHAPAAHLAGEVQGAADDVHLRGPGGAECGEVRCGKREEGSRQSIEEDSGAQA
jgi:hypothetical protein